jgi:hypothetical protein
MELSSLVKVIILTDHWDPPVTARDHLFPFGVARVWHGRQGRLRVAVPRFDENLTAQSGVRSRACLCGAQKRDSGLE